ncbi:hypothetical protein ACFXGI_25855 [Streptomyces sp. NPDC059355]|uniref:hypothetical protein n=1 Tax=Streptomyces sp. NPDC059355 TaxID=3346811 RepID=UPI003694810B
MKRITMPVTAGALAASTVTAGAAVAANDSAASPAAAVMPASVPCTVEEFGFPDAETILKKDEIPLEKGNGNVLLTECGFKDIPLEVSGGQNEGNRFCFEVKGKPGYPTQELPGVYGVYSVKGVDRKVPVDTGPRKREHTLVEIRTGA